MPPRLSPQGFSSFIAFYSCSLQALRCSTRPYSLYSSQCRRYSGSQPYRARMKRLSDKRLFHASSSRASKNPYNVLGVKPDATASDIKKAYFALARKYHPDTNPDKNARDKFVEIQDAYDTLKDDKKRAAFDQYGAASQQPGFDPDAFSKGFGGSGFGAGGFRGFEDLGAAFSGAYRGGRQGEAADFFNQLFGSFGAGQTGTGFAGRSRGEDIQASVSISFLDACKGVNKNVHVHPIVDCDTCHGNGLKEGVKRTTCSTCGGSGTRTFVVDKGFHMASTCPTCSGLGSTIPRHGQCLQCGGAGKVRTKKTVEVNIPAGVEDGMVISIANAGDAALHSSGIAGDLLVRIQVGESKTFRRQGNNLYYSARIPLHTAILGGKVRVPTLDGDVDVRVPGGTQPGQEMVLRGRGVTRVQGSGNGDLFVTFSVTIPRALTKRQKDLLQAYADDVDGQTTTAGFSDSAKEPTMGSEKSTEDKDNVKVETPTEFPENGNLDKKKGNEKKRATG